MDEREEEVAPRARRAAQQAGARHELGIGGVFAQLVQLLPGIPAWVHTYEPLTIALTVIVIAKGAQGLPQNAYQQAQYCMAVLYRLPRPDWLQPALPSARTSDGAAASAVPWDDAAVAREVPAFSAPGGEARG